MKFQMGELVCTPGVLTAIPSDTMVDYLRRHLRGDWGDIDPEDQDVNEQALERNERIMSVYNCQSVDGKPTKFWIITEADRSATTILLPDEY